MSFRKFPVSSFDHETADGKVHITMLPNPSHLEAQNPVAMGKARGRARLINSHIETIQSSWKFVLFLDK